MVDEAVVGEVVEHLCGCVGEIGFAVVLTEFETAEFVEEGEDVDWVHVHLIRVSTGGPVEEVKLPYKLRSLQVK